MKRVFISHPFLGKRQNLEAIKHICKSLVPYGVMPVSPVLAFSFMNDKVPEERSKALEWCEDMVEWCDCLFLFGEWEKSEGCCRERDTALKLFRSIYVVDGWLDGKMIIRGEWPKWLRM